MNAAAPPLDDAIGAQLMAKLGLVRESALSDDGDSFVTLVCRERNGTRVVLKYVIPDAPRDAYRRLANETEMLQRVPMRSPLRVLRYRGSGTGYLVTDFDRGRLLRPHSIGEPAVFGAIADALACFQRLPIDSNVFNIRDRESAGVYYVKVLAKHLLHLWPDDLDSASAARATLVVTGALPSMLRRSALSHGDFLPTNLLYHDEDGSVTFTDLESVSFNHPLFDVLALFTVDERDIDDWDWQASFLRRYLEGMDGTPGLDPALPEFWSSYRGILTFFLVYRLNETILNGQRYFGGLSKGRYVRARLRRLLGTRRPETRGPRKAAVMTRRRNVIRMLSRTSFERHLERMHPALSTAVQ